MLLFFILGDILGAGIYALVGEVAGEVGGAIWTAFATALTLALQTAFAYTELVTKYPHAGGAALFVNRAFKNRALTFVVAFAVMASGVMSASTLARAFVGEYLHVFVDIPTTVAALVLTQPAISSPANSANGSLTASMVVPTADLADSDGPLLEVVRRVSDIPTRVFSAIALLAIANGALINMIMASRLLYGMAEERVMPRAFGRVHPGRRTPWVAVLFMTAVAMLLISIGELDDVATVTVMLLLIVFVLVNVSVLVLRREPVAHEHFVAPAFAPIAGIAISLILLVKRVTDEDLSAFLVSLPYS
jgi:amino acid transporter